MTRTLILATAFAVLAVGWASGAEAQADSGLARRQELVAKIIEVQGGADNMRAVMVSTGEAAATGLLKNLPASKVGEERAFIHDMMSEIAARMAPKLMVDAEKIWAVEFTEDQLKDMLVFYESPTGRALTAKMPEVSRQVGLILARRAPEIQLMSIDAVCTKYGCPADVKAKVEDAKKKLASDGSL